MIKNLLPPGSVHFMGTVNSVPRAECQRKALWEEANKSNRSPGPRAIATVDLDSDRGNKELREDACAKWIRRTFSEQHSKHWVCRKPGLFPSTHFSLHRTAQQSNSVKVRLACFFVLINCLHKLHTSSSVIWMNFQADTRSKQSFDFSLLFRGRLERVS